LTSGKPQVLHPAPAEQAAGKQSDSTWNMVYNELSWCCICSTREFCYICCLFVHVTVFFSIAQNVACHITLQPWMNTKWTLHMFSFQPDWCPKVCWDLVEFQCRLLVSKKCWGIFINPTFLLYRLQNSLIMW
jgi:hypothetical protein